MDIDVITENTTRQSEDNNAAELELKELLAVVTRNIRNEIKERDAETIATATQDMRRPNTNPDAKTNPDSNTVTGMQNMPRPKPNPIPNCNPRHSGTDRTSLTVYLALPLCDSDTRCA